MHCDDLSGQQLHWDLTFSKKMDMFGERQSEAAMRAMSFIDQEKSKHILELGGGQGRDTFYFASKGMRVNVLDYSASGISQICEGANLRNLSSMINAQVHDMRRPLPFDEASFDVCYSHMFYCMAFTTAQLEFISSEVLRVLQPGGIHIFTVRHTGDDHFEKGIHRGENLYEVSGFIVHFFSKDKIYHLSTGYEIMAIDELEEGNLPRKLFQVVMRKKN